MRDFQLDTDLTDFIEPLYDRENSTELRVIDRGFYLDCIIDGLLIENLDNEDALAMLVEVLQYFEVKFYITRIGEDGLPYVDKDFS